MKARLFFALAAFALTLSATPGSAAAPSQSCLSYCSIVRCIEGYVCGPYTNSSGQTVCGCHPDPFRP